MAGHNPPKSPSVNNLISFWSDFDVNPEGTPSTPSRPRGPYPIVNQQQQQQRIPSATALNAARSAVGLRSQSPLELTQPPSNPQPYRLPYTSPSIPTLSSSSVSSSPSPSHTSAPLFPLRSVAPVQSKVFGTQRHALDTIHVRPLASPPAQAPRVMGPRAAHHIPLPPISTSAQGQSASTATAPMRTLPSRRQSGDPEGAVDPRTMLKRIGNEAGSATLRRLSSKTERPGLPNGRQGYRQRGTESANAAQSSPISILPQAATSPTTPSPPSSDSSLPALQPHSRGEEGIMKLAVIPPAGSKEDTWKHHHHLARSHPLVSASAPLGRPLDALLPLGKDLPSKRQKLECGASLFK